MDFLKTRAMVAGTFATIAHQNKYYYTQLMGIFCCIRQFKRYKTKISKKLSNERFFVLFKTFFDISHLTDSIFGCMMQNRLITAEIVPKKI